MPSTIPTVTVGIPAYNEEANIVFLINDLLRQHEHGFVIEKILVVSDGSTDRTVERVNAISDKRIEIRDHELRRGLAERQNELLSSLTHETDAIVLIQGDVRLASRRTLSELVRPVLEDQADLVSGRVMALAPRTLTEHALYVSHLLKLRLFEQWRKGRNLYTCTGVARAFSRRLASKLRFVESVGEDAYSYLFCRTKGFRYAYAKNAEVLIRLPDNFEDHARQSIRFHQSRDRFSGVFDRRSIEHEYSLPFSRLAFSEVARTIGGGLALVVFCFIILRVKWRALFATRISQVWDVAESSKKLVIANNHKRS